MELTSQVIEIKHIYWQALDNKVFPAPTNGKLKEITNPTEKPKRMGVLMNTRPLNYFISCALLSVITLSSAWAQQDVRVGPSMGDGAMSAASGEGIQTPRGANAADAAALATGALVLGNVEDSGPRAGTADEGTPVTSIDSTDRPRLALGLKNAGAASDTPRRCGLDGQALSPEFESIVNSFCPLDNRASPGYCDCIRTFINTSPAQPSSNRGIQPASLAVSAAAREGEMLRIGYQYILEDWADEYGAAILNIASLQANSRGSQVVSTLPESCKPAVIFQRLRTRTQSGNCPGFHPAFAAAAGQALRAPPDTNIFGMSGDQINQLMSESEVYDRFYTQSRDGIGARTFRDCMEPSEKRAYALLPISFTSGDEASVGDRRDYQGTVMNALGKMINESSQIDASTRGALLPVLDIFPGMELLLRGNSGLTTEERRALTRRLLSFVDDLDDPAYANLRDARSSAALMARMQANVLAVKNEVSAKLAEINRRQPNTVQDQVAATCEGLIMNLEAVACQPEDFLHSPDYMEMAFIDAGERRTSHGARLARECSEPTPGMNDRLIENCLLTHNAQCNSLRRQPQTRSTSEKALNESYRAISTVRALHMGKPESLELEFRNYSTIRKAEEDVARLMCTEFNDYIRSNQCASVAQAVDVQGISRIRSVGHRIADLARSPDERRAVRQEQARRANEYRRCAINYTLDQFNAATGGNERSRAITDFGFQTPTVSRSLSAGRENLLENMALAEADITPVIKTSDAPTTSLASTIRNATSGLGSTGSGIGSTATGIIPIDPPESRTDVRDAAAITQREQANQEAERRITEIDNRIEAIGPAPQNDALAAELRALREEMAATRTRSDRYEQEIASLRERMTNPASGDDSDDAVVAGNRRALENSTGGSGAGRGIASAGFTTAGSGGSDQGSPAFSPEINRASVNTTFGGIGASRGLIEAARDRLPAATLNPLALRVGDSSYPVGQVYTVKIPAGVEANDDAILRRIFEARASIQLDAQQRAMVEIFDEATGQSRVVYVQFAGDAVSLLPYEQGAAGQPAANEGVRATLAQLEGLIGAGRGAEGIGN